MTSKSKPPGVIVGAVVNAAAILRHLAVQPEPAGVNAIARATGVSPSSCFNILRTLAHERLATFDPGEKTYRSGPGLADLFPAQPNERAAFERCAAILQDFSDRHGSTTALWRVASSERLVLLGFTDGRAAMRLHMTVGLRLPLLAGAGGRCVAAALQMSDEEIAERHEQLRWRSPPGLARFRREIREAARLGWALDDGDFLSGVTTIASAIPSQGRPQFVVGASWFQRQRTPAELAEIGQSLLHTRDRARVALDGISD